MVSSVSRLGIKLSKGQLAAIKRDAKRLGLTPAEYTKELVEQGLAMARQARQTPLEVLAAPFHEAYKGMTDEELDAMVEVGRRSPGRRRRSH